MRCLVLVIVTMLFYSCSDSTMKNYSTNTLYPFYNDKKWGYSDSTGRIVLPVMYDKVSLFENNVALVNKSGQNFIINNLGKKLSPEYKDLERINHKYFYAKKNNAIFSIQSGKLGKVRNEVLFATNYGKDGIAYINEKQLIIKHCEKKRKIQFSNYVSEKDTIQGLYSINLNIISVVFNNWDLIFNKDGKLISKALSYTIGQNSIITLIKPDGSSGAVNYKGDTVLEFKKYDNIESNGAYIKAFDKSKYIIYNTNTNTRINIKEEVLKFTGYSYFISKKNKKVGLISFNGRTILTCTNDSIIMYNDSLVWVKKNNQWNLYNCKENIQVSKIKYDNIKSIFKNINYGIVMLNKTYGIIDFNAKFVIPPKYTDIIYCQEGFYLLKTGENQKLFNSNENIIHDLNQDFQYATFSNGVGVAQLENLLEQVLIDKTGREISQHFYKIFPNETGLSSNFFWAIPLNYPVKILINTNGIKYGKFPK